MKRTPLLTPALDEPKSLKITYRRTIPMRDEGSLGAVVVDVTDGHRYLKTPRGWEDANLGPLREFIDDQIIRDAGTVATGKFKDDAIKSAFEKLLKLMRAAKITSCHHEGGYLREGWAK